MMNSILPCGFELSNAFIPSGFATKLVYAIILLS
jgi:hypothetical protein